MTPEEAQQLLQHQIEQLKNLHDNLLPDIIGVEAVKHFKENFQVEGFVNEVKEPWKEVKRRLDPRVRGARSTRKILTGDTGELGNSIAYEKGPGNDQVTIYSDKPYAEAHNEGTTTAGRGNTTTIPQRQFLGKSEALEEKIEQKITREIDKIMNPT